ncbi:IS1380-Spn1 transposase [Streptococcus pneumoniae]|nr:IS1380-Spn1 transposase [Streptococcus pneumoniae]
MSNIEQQLAELRQSTLDRLKEIHHEGEKELQDLRVSVFGKKGSLTDLLKPQLFTPNLKTIQNPCLSLDPGWFLFSPNGCFLLDKKSFPFMV